MTDLWVAGVERSEPPARPVVSGDAPGARSARPQPPGLETSLIRQIPYEVAVLGSLGRIATTRLGSVGATTEEPDYRPGVAIGLISPNIATRCRTQPDRWVRSAESRPVRGPVIRFGRRDGRRPAVGFGRRETGLAVRWVRSARPLRPSRGGGLASFGARTSSRRWVRSARTIRRWVRSARMVSGLASTLASGDELSCELPKIYPRLSCPGRDSSRKSVAIRASRGSATRARAGRERREAKDDGRRMCISHGARDSG
jgi:hypothetical protein